MKALNEFLNEEKTFKYAGNEFTGYINNHLGGFALFVAFGDSRSLKNNKAIGKALVKTYNKLTGNKRPETDFSYDINYDIVKIEGITEPEIKKLEAYFEKIKNK
jgi:hypothetical protein